MADQSLYFRKTLHDLRLNSRFQTLVNLIVHLTNKLIFSTQSLSEQLCFVHFEVMCILALIFIDIIVITIIIHQPCHHNHDWVSYHINTWNCWFHIILPRGTVGPDNPPEWAGRALQGDTSWTPEWKSGAKNTKYGSRAILVMAIIVGPESEWLVMALVILVIVVITMATVSILLELTRSALKLFWPMSFFMLFRSNMTPPLK